MPRSKKIFKDSKVMSDLLASKDISLKTLISGEIIEGTVVSVTHGEILVDVGAKSEGIISG